MKIVLRLLTLVVMIAFVGCAAGGGGSSSGGPPSGGSSSVETLTDADFERMGIRETYEKR